MRKLFFIVPVLLCIACNDQDQETFTIEGSIKNSNATTVYLEENPVDAQPMIVDSAKLDKDGRFTLSTVVAEEGMFSLRTEQHSYPFALLINDSPSVTVEADLSNESFPYSVKGSEASQAMLDFDKKVNESLQVHLQLVKEIDSLNKLNPSSTPEKNTVDSIINIRFAQYEANADSLKQFAMEFLQKSKSAVLALYAFGSFQTRATQYGLKAFTKAETVEMINQLAARFPEHTVLNEQKKKLKPAVASDFTMADTTGNPVALSSFRGKWVLVDFWASWCVPCRKENPNIVAAYQQFKDKNFTILGVSLDKEKEPWIQAIHTDRLTWHHVSDLKHWDNEAANLYGVRSIPYNVLIDPSGNIVAENLHGRELQNTLGKFIK